MSCNENSPTHLCNTLKKIERAQHLAEKEHQSYCCEGIHSLKEKKNLKNTIPIMLICRESCGVFIGSGVFKHGETFECMKTPVFRVSKVIKEEDGACNVKLELLQPQCKFGDIPYCNVKDICSFFSEYKIKKFIRTGICITVDISCFCGIECLPAVQAECGKPVPVAPSRKMKVIEEEICGNFGAGVQTVWESMSDYYIEGTFQIYNSAQSSSAVKGFIEASTPVVFPAVMPGSTITRSTDSPTAFKINAPLGTHGKYCINLTKAIPLKDCE